VTQPRRSLDAGLTGVFADLLLAGLLGAFLSVATEPTGDVVPRPIVLAVLYAVPGVIGLIGVRARRRWVLVAAALPLLPGSLLSFTGVTLVFIAPAALMLIGASDMRAEPGHRGNRALTAATAIFVAALVVAAGWAAVIGLTESGCVAIPGGQTCSSAFVSVRGVLVASACLVAAVAIAAWGSGRPQTADRRSDV
jgi:hypothetical protein